MTVVDENARVDAGDAVEDGFGEVEFPLVLPRVCDVLQLVFCIYSLLLVHTLSNQTLPIFSYLLLIHGQDIQRLIEFYPLTGTNITSIVLIYHFYLNY